MANLYKERELGQAAEQILKNETWEMAWNAYRARLLEEMERADSKQDALVLHLKRMLSAAAGARGHLERIMNEGAVAAKSIEFEEKRSTISKLFKG